MERRSLACGELCAHRARGRRDQHGVHAERSGPDRQVSPHRQLPTAPPPCPPSPEETPTRSHGPSSPAWCAATRARSARRDLPIRERSARPDAWDRHSGLGGDLFGGFAVAPFQGFVHPERIGTQTVGGRRGLALSAVRAPSLPTVSTTSSMEPVRVAALFLISSRQSTETGELIGPGTTMTTLPRTPAVAAVFRILLQRLASTTTGPSLSAAISRLPTRNRCRAGEGFRAGIRRRPDSFDRRSCSAGGSGSGLRSSGSIASRWLRQPRRW
jgi:hypothetical protein